MKHLSKTKTFHRKRNQRRALIQSLAHNLILKSKIKTTTARAKYLKRVADKLVTVAKKQNMSVLRLLLARLPKKSAYKLYYEIAPRFKEKQGGYTRVTKLASPRIKDAAEMSLIEFTE